MNFPEPDNSQKQRLISILRNHDWFMDALNEVNKLKMTQWCIGAGIIRNIVFDYLQGITNPSIRDVDVAYYNPEDLSETRDKEYESILNENMPEIPWEVTNQAGVHLWYHKIFGYKVDPIISIEDAVSTWPETCTSIGITITKVGKIEVFTPFGLDDLFGMIIRRNPRRIDIRTYNERIHKKKYSQTWKSVKIFHEPIS